MTTNHTLQRRAYRWVHEDTSRITATATAHLNAVYGEILERVVSFYPKTTHALFDTALHLIEGQWGDKLKDKYSMPSEMLSSPRDVLALLLLELSFYNPPWPEIFPPFEQDPKWQQLRQTLQNSSDEELYQFVVHDDKAVREWIERVQVEPEHLKGLMQLFDNFIDNLNNPSSALIHLFLENGLKDKAIQMALSLRYPLEKSKSIAEIIDLLILENNISKALEIWQHLPLAYDKHSIALKLIHHMLDNDLVDQALGFVAGHPKHKERDILTKEIALGLGKNGVIDKALDIIRTIEDKDLQLYTLSCLVRLLARQNKIHRAKEIAFSILDEEYKQDAIVEIVKSYLHNRKVDEAIHFVNALPESEKMKPAKVIEIALQVQHQDEKIRNLRNIFSLYQTLKLHE